MLPPNQTLPFSSWSIPDAPPKTSAFIAIDPFPTSWPEVDFIPVIRMRSLMAEDITGGPRRGSPAEYNKMKAEHHGFLLVYRVGRFYELFFADAEIAAKVLGLKLTKLRYGDSKGIAMCRVPVWEDDDHINRLADQGHRVAVCEMVKDGPWRPRRMIVRFVTPVAAEA